MTYPTQGAELEVDADSNRLSEGCWTGLTVAGVGGVTVNGVPHSLVDTLCVVVEAVGAVAVAVPQVSEVDGALTVTESETDTETDTDTEIETEVIDGVWTDSVDPAAVLSDETAVVDPSLVLVHSAVSVLMHVVVIVVVGMAVGEPSALFAFAFTG